MKAFINGIGNISPQHTVEGAQFLQTPVSYSGNVLSAIEPDYATWINPGQLRRMSRILKMGTASAFMALKHSGIQVPDAIITGTGYGCLEDTATFLGKITTLNETALNPTPFMQSTHNTIGSQIALLLQCQGYNQTYVHDAFSFEHSVLDALMTLAENPDLNILTGGVEEVTRESHQIMERFRIYRKNNDDSLKLLDVPASGSLHGEGACYFVLSGKGNDKSSAQLHGVQTCYRPDAAAISEAVNSLLENAKLRPDQIDIVLSGRAGKSHADEYCDHVQKMFSKSAVAYYKHLSGEHCVASTFALWAATRIIEAQAVPQALRPHGKLSSINNVLIYNPSFNGHHAFMLVSKCQPIRK